MLDNATLDTLRRRAFDLRIDSLTAIAAAGSGHPGGTLSAIDVLQVLFFGGMRHRPKEPHWPERDRFVLSKGHAVPALYAVLARAGYFSVDLLTSLRRLGSPLQGYAANALLPGIEAATGSPGQGFSIAIGMALAARLDGGPARVYTLLGDGESEEGQIWEAATVAPRFRLDNLCAILDHNRAPKDGERLAERWRSFDFHVLTVDGHDAQAIAGALEAARAARGRPTLIVAETVEGKGVSFMENAAGWHGVAPNADQLARAVAELRAGQARLAPGAA